MENEHMELARKIGRIAFLTGLGLMTMYIIFVYFKYINGWGDNIGYEKIETYLMKRGEYLAYIITPIGIFVGCLLRNKIIAGVTISLQFIFQIIKTLVFTYFNSNGNRSISEALIFIGLYIIAMVIIFLWIKERLSWFFIAMIIMVYALFIFSIFSKVIAGRNFWLNDRNVHNTFADLMITIMYVIPFAVLKRIPLDDLMI